MQDRSGFRDQTLKHYFYNKHNELQNIFRYRISQRPFIKYSLLFNIFIIGLYESFFLLVNFLWSGAVPFPWL